MHFAPKPRIAAVLADEHRDLRSEIMVGFLYWLAVLLILEPGNVWRAAEFGYALRLDQEAIRICGASLLGAAATPLMLEQMRRFPLEGRRWRFHALAQGLGCMMVAAALIVLSCVLAKWLLVAEQRPLMLAMRRELIQNWGLLVFCLGGFVAGAQGVRVWAKGRGTPSPVPDFLTRITVRERGHIEIVDTSDIDWIEAQGNYVAVHVGKNVHLIRETLARLEPQLDPRHFLRIHRSAIVALDRMTSMSSIGAGDAQILLKNGTTVRASRTYRARVESALGARR